MLQIQSFCGNEKCGSPSRLKIGFHEMKIVLFLMEVQKIRAKTKILLLALFLFSSAASAEIYLFTDSNEYRGCLDCSRYSSDSICNRYGNFGNRYSSDSIWSRYGAGSRYDNDSPFSRYGSGLKMVDDSGGFYGYMSMSVGGERRMRNYLRDLWEITSGNYQEMRDIFCDN